MPTMEEVYERYYEQNDALRGKYPMWKPLARDLEREGSNRLIQRFQERAGDSVSTSPITAQRLDPEVIPTYVRAFPFFDLMEKEPSNGISHTFLQETAPSLSTTPHTIAETGTVNPDSNAYSRKTTNIAVFGMQRGVSLKAQYAGLNAGGPSTDLMAREVKGGLTTIARDAQREMLSYTETYSSSSGATDPNGAYDVDGLNGMRYIMYNQIPPGNQQYCDIREPWTDQRVLTALRDIASAITDQGGEPDLVVATTTGSNALFEDQMELVRYMDNTKTLEITPGRRVRTVSTDAGDLPVLIVPGQNIAMGNWVATGASAGAVYIDLFVLQTNTWSIPYLGAPEPTVIRLPLAVDGTLRELAIPFAMYGLACKVPQFNGRVSLRIG